MRNADAEKTAQLLRAADAGNAAAGEELFVLLYGQLKDLAEHRLHRERQDHTLQPTALVHETYLRLAGASAQDAPDPPRTRGRFLALAARAMDHVLLDHARRRGAAKRKGERHKVQFETTLHEPATGSAGRVLDALAVREALAKLRQLHERQAKIAELRLWAGMTGAEIASVLQVSLRTVDGDWRMAKAWLSRELREPAEA